MKRLISLTFVALLTTVLFGCGREVERKPALRPAESETPVAEPTGQKPAAITTNEELQAALKAANPKFDGEAGVATDGPNIVAVGINDPAIEDISPLAGLALLELDLRGCHVTDISPLKGMPLEMLYLEDTGVRDISALKGMPLVKLWMSNTGVDDLSPLKGAQRLEELNLVGTRVSDLSPLRGMRRLRMLWLTKCPVSDISPLQDVPSLESLTIAETKVSDLSPLKGHGLERLHIAGTEVTDLSALQWMRLTRLIFTPGRIETGIEFARNMPTLTQIDTRFDDQYTRPMSPLDFWQRYDAGEFK